MQYLLLAIDRIAFKIGNLEVAWYGLIIVSAMIVGLFYIMWQAKKINLTSDDAIEYFLWLIPLAIVFARLLYVIVRPEDYFDADAWAEDPGQAFVDMIAIWDGGITIIGGILGGLIGIGIFSYRMRKKTNFGQITDLVVVPVLFGQIVGRLGNFINQEAFGLPAKTLGIPEKFPFAIYIDNASGVSPEYRDIVYSADNYPGWFAATFFYEMCWNFVGIIVCLVLWNTGKSKKYPGILGIFYFFWYFLGRGLLEFVRIDAVPITQIACFVMAPIALILLVLYVLTKASTASFRKVNGAIVDGTLAQIEISAFDVKNYNAVVKMLKNSYFMWNLYKVKSLNIITLDASNITKKPKKETKNG